VSGGLECYLFVQDLTRDTLLRC